MKKDLLPVRRAWLPVVACALVVLTGASGAFAAPGPGAPGPGAPGSKLHIPVTPLPVPPSTVIIDDFSTGPDTLAAVTGFDQKGQPGGMVGNARCIRLDASDNPYARPNTVAVDGGHLFLETGVGVGHLVTLTYGVDERCANRPMNLNLAASDRFRMEFDLLDLPLAGGLAVWSPSGISSIPICGTGVGPGVGFTCDMPFSDFTGDADFEHIQYIAVVLETGGAIFSHDYGLKSITALSDPGAAAGQHLSTLRSTTRPPARINPAAIRSSR
jgi:hypothetical protein